MSYADSIEFRNRAIHAYLRKHGPMSGRDIVADLMVGEFLLVDEVDVDLAEQLGVIVRVAPPHGGVGPWFAAAPRGVSS